MERDGRAGSRHGDHAQVAVLGDSTRTRSVRGYCPRRGRIPVRPGSDAACRAVRLEAAPVYRAAGSGPACRGTGRGIGRRSRSVGRRSRSVGRRSRSIRRRHRSVGNRNLGRGGSGRRHRRAGRHRSIGRHPDFGRLLRCLGRLLIFHRLRRRDLARKKRRNDRGRRPGRHRRQPCRKRRGWGLPGGGRTAARGARPGKSPAGTGLHPRFPT